MTGIPKTIARSNLARANAARAGYPVLQGAKIKLFALSKVARSGATRANYTSNKPFISVGGVQVGTVRPGVGVGVLIESLTLTDALSSTPTTGSLTAYGWVPVDGADVVITLGSVNNARREFGGTILHTKHRYVGDKPVAQNMLYDCALIDYAWGLSRRKVSGKYTATTVGAVAASLMTAAPAGYTLQVAADIAAKPLDEITFTEQSLDNALGQLVTRVGGDWQCDYTKVVRLFFTDTSIAPPAIVNALHKSLTDLAWVRDLSQVVTRVYVDAGGSSALEAVAPGETRIPVETAAWYLAAGGTVLAGPQRVQYTGIDLGGRGSLVGPGASPSAPINALVVPGAGVTPGAHSYAVTFVTASGESIPSPQVGVSVGTYAPPTPALVAGAPTGSVPGPDPGAHSYALTNVISSGETTIGPSVAMSTGITAPPPTGPNATLGAEGAGPDFGTHDYAVSFATASGETPPGPIGSSVTAGNTPINPPAAAPVLNTPTSGGAVEYGAHAYGATFITAYGETTIGPLASVTLPANPVPNPGVAPVLAYNGSASGGPNGGQLYYAYTYKTAIGETLISPSALITPIGQLTDVTAYGWTDARITGINIYRYCNEVIAGSPAFQWGLVATVANHGTGQPSLFTDSYYAATTAPPSINNTDQNKTVPVRSIPRGSSNVVARKLYRSKAGASAMQFLVTLNDNTTTSYDDALADAALGAAPPASNTALGLFAVNLDTIPRGPTGAAVTARKLFRRSGGAGLRFLDVIADNTATTYTDTKSNAALGGAPPSTNTATLQQIPLSAIPVGAAGVVTARKLYRTKAGGSIYYLLATLDNLVTTYLDTTPDASLGAVAPSTNTATAALVQLTAIPLGAAAVTSRRVYRTAAGGAQLKLLTTLADNVTTAYNDALADATLGVNAPTSDTSLLTQPSGAVAVGSVALPCASVAAFLAGGGWAIAGSQILKYTGITGNSLTGIPASGVGSIAATIAYNATVAAAPMLTGIPASGVGAIRVAIIKGDAVDLFVQEDDTAAQAALAAQLGGGSDGIVEDELQDRRLSNTEAHARARARLAQLAARDADGKVGLITVTYACRDINTRAGATVSINLGPPVNLRGDFLIQHVTIAGFGVPHIPPTYTVEASSVRFTFEALLRVMAEGAA